jgi:ketosteroid isomerase-like protein
MSRENTEIARRGIEQLNRQVSAEKLDLSLFAPDIVVDNSNAAFDGAVYRGHDGVCEWLSWARGMWKRQQIEPEQFIPVDEDRVVVPVRIVSVGRDDVEVVARAAALLTVDEGKITHMKTFQGRGEALQAVGLSEQAPSSN